MSVDPPTSLPTGIRLTERALERLYPEGTLRNVKQVYSEFQRNPPLPRLETVLGVAAAEDVHGLHALAILEQLTDAIPNALHHFLAEHLRLGGGQVTANFDLCVERAAGIQGSGRLVHLHGRIDSPESVRHGASVAFLDQGIPDDVGGRIRHLLAQADLAVFIGYSGSDYFDVDPFLREWAINGGARGKSVLWVNHRLDNEGFSLAVGPECRRRQLVWLHHGGARVVEAALPTVDLLDLLAQKWNVFPPRRSPAMEPQSDAEPPSAPAFGAPACGLAALKLYLHLGASRLADDVLARFEIPEQVRQEALAEIAWSRGQYADARRHYNARWTGSDPATKLRRRERVAATHWVQGRVLLSTAILIKAIASAQRDQLDPAPAAETLVRVIEKGRSNFETRWLPWRRLQKWALDLLPARTSGHGTHLNNRYTVLRIDVAAPADVRSSIDAHTRAMESFAEYEALHGVLNFEHGRLRRLLSHGQAAVPEDYWRLRRWAIALGRTESEVKAQMLSGAGTAFPLWSAVRGVMRLQVTPWHRLRMVSQHRGGPLTMRRR